ncbi:MAG: aminotransferase class IV [Gammaproteobacteria bacterium]|nr:aminotransferase class IV [Gammaproteobacteria bacterium]
MRRDFIHLRVCDYRLPVNPRLAGLNTLDRLDQVLAASELPPDRDGLLLDTEARVIEGLAGNIFVRTADGWLTPDLGGAGVRSHARLFARRDFSRTGNAGARNRGVIVASTRRPGAVSVQCGARYRGGYRH